MSKYNHYSQNYIPTKTEKTQYLKQYFNGIIIAVVIFIPFAIYFANMKP